MVSRRLHTSQHGGCKQSPSSDRPIPVLVFWVQNEPTVVEKLYGYTYIYIRVMILPTGACIGRSNLYRFKSKSRFTDRFGVPTWICKRNRLWKGLLNEEGKSPPSMDIPGSPKGWEQEPGMAGQPKNLWLQSLAKPLTNNSI